MIWVITKVLLHLLTGLTSQFKGLLLTIFTDGESLDYLLALLVNGDSTPHLHLLVPTSSG